MREHDARIMHAIDAMILAESDRLITLRTWLHPHLTDIQDRHILKHLTRSVRRDDEDDDVDRIRILSKVSIHLLIKDAMLLRIDRHNLETGLLQISHDLMTILIRIVRRTHDSVGETLVDEICGVHTKRMNTEHLKDLRMHTYKNDSFVYIPAMTDLHYQHNEIALIQINNETIVTHTELIASLTH